VLFVVVVEVAEVDVCAEQTVAATKEKALIINNLVFISAQLDKLAPDTREFICRFQTDVARIGSDRR
jgi:hypothetical protein